MEKVGRGQVPPVPRKEKKKQAKDELDRQKQAEKKKRRLEKALANSAAIRSELEKKKQKKIEEQQRLDEEGAAIAEAVALHVLLGEDTDEPCQIMMNNNKRFNPWDNSSNIGLLMGYQSFAKYSVEELGWVSDTYASRCKCNDCGIGWSLSPGMQVTDLQAPYLEETYQGAEISAGLVAAQAVSSLQIAEDSHAVPFTSKGASAVVINRMCGRQRLG